MTDRGLFEYEPDPVRGQSELVADGIRRIVANNPGKMTYHGTNSYIVDTPEGRLVVDPGPAEDSAHFEAIVQHLGQNSIGILVTHHHTDHFGAAPALRDRTGLPVYVASSFPDDAFEPDGHLEDGQTIAGLTVLHTPGHASDHICLSRSDGILFSGDHVMSWNSSIVNPPDGSMLDYCRQLQRLADRKEKMFLPGHGPALQNPSPFVERLLSNRIRREAEILDHICQTPDTISNIAASVYRKTDPMIAKAAERNAMAHLEKLLAESRVEQDGEIWRFGRDLTP